jgi:hypothetical protein
MKRDQKLVSLFLEEYTKIGGEAFQVKEWVDDAERNKPAVEAIAVDESTGKRLAIEHTLLQPFEGEKEDSHRFLTVIGNLEKDDSLRVPRYMISINFQVGAIPKGVNWTEVNKTLDRWIRENVAKLDDDQSNQTIRHDNLEIQTKISKMTLPHNEKGILVFSRGKPPDSLPDVMRTAFKKKLPKLVGTHADKRILLFEQNSLLHGNGDIHEVVKTLEPEFDDLKQVEEIWLVGTVGWESDDFLWFTRIWPDIATWVDGRLQ